MKEYPISFLVRLQPKHMNFIVKRAKKGGISRAEYIRLLIEKQEVKVVAKSPQQPTSV